MKTLLLVLLLFSPLQAQSVWWEGNYNGKYYSGWYSADRLCCNSPTCQMRQDILGMIAAQRAQYVAYNPSQEYETVQVPYQVKMCNGRTCWYETRYRTERRPIRNLINLLRVPNLRATPQEAVVELLSLASPSRDEVLYDLGCGDGRILIAATFAYGCRSVGIELNQDSYNQAVENVKNFELDNKVRVYQGDVLKYEYPDADVVTMYLYPELMEKILPKLRPGTRVISYLHSIPGGRRIVVRDHVFYVWIKP